MLRFLTNTLRRLAGICLLLVFCVEQMQALPLLMAGITSLDGEHEVDIVQTSQGVHVVLHHHRQFGGSPTQSPPGHRHSDIIKWFIGAEGNGSDHDVFFAAIAQTVLSHQAEQGLEIGNSEAKTCSSVSLIPDSPGLWPLDVLSLECGTPQWWPPSPSRCEWGFMVMVV